MVEGAEETSGGHRREVLEPLDNRYLAVADVDATDEDAETVYDEGGVEVAKLRHRHEEFEGVQVDSSVQGSLENPGDTSEI